MRGKGKQGLGGPKYVGSKQRGIQKGHKIQVDALPFKQKKITENDVYSMKVLNNKGFKEVLWRKD